MWTFIIEISSRFVQHATAFCLLLGKDHVNSVKTKTFDNFIIASDSNL